MKGFFLLNLGCAKNLVEGEHIAGAMITAGYDPCASPEEAGILMVNTCGFIRPAVEESIEEILNLAQQRRGDQKLVVIGCMVGRYGKKLQRNLPEVDLFVAPGQVSRLPRLLSTGEKQHLAISRPLGIFNSRDTRAITTGPGWAYLRIGDGCMHRCSFCTIPAIRGGLRSREVEDILTEARALGASGIKELVLVAQDLTAYGRDLGGSEDLAFLIREIDKITAIKWVRLLYLHPDTLDEKIFYTIAQSRAVVPYLDIPLQHIAHKVLTAMGRKRLGRELRELISQARELLPQAVVRTTLMVGHPGEGCEEFAELLAWVEEFQFDHLGSFVFEAEPGTKSARLPRPRREKALARHEELMALQARISREKMAGLLGTRQEIIVLGPHPESELLWKGRLWSQAPEVDGETIIVGGSANLGQIAQCRITKSHDFDLEAELLD